MTVRQERGLARREPVGGDRGDPIGDGHRSTRSAVCGSNGTPPRRPRPPRSWPRAAALNREAGGLLRGHLTAVVVAGRQLEILAIETAVGVLVFDPHVRELHVVAARPGRPWASAHARISSADRVGRPERSPAVSVRLLQEALVVPLQLVVHDDAADPATAGVQTLRGLGVQRGRAARHAWPLVASTRPA